ncbi:MULTISPECIES: hypothetical protein [Psychrobacter]|uniref:hypothetical protein n=1 Tax=Psychrobacter TaxID=497 RepID=UPI000EEC5CCA|nr:MULTISPECIES: hypothetical protein [Psychrobacter]HCT73526.1 hypothetical protein [Psychrobacter sp.]
MSDTLYDADGIRIYTYHSFAVNDKFSENLDFFLDYKGNIYAGTVFSLNCVIAYMEDTVIDSPFNNYFWAPYTIVIKEFSSEYLIASILEIISDKKVLLEDVVCKQI